VVAPLVQGENPGSTEKKLIEKLFPGRKDISDQLALISKKGPEADVARESLIDDLLDRHGAGRAVYRNTRAAIPGFPKRKIHAAALSVPESDPDAADKIQAEICFELGLSDKLPRKPMEKDPRVEWLVKLLTKHPAEKFLLICRYQKRAEQLFEAIQARINISMTVFHEEQTIIQRDRNAAWFSQPAPDGARLLICSEIGSEGRNFQFAHHLVLYDLPVDPELLEQRIGRLDRIGQRETIHLHVPFFKGSGGEALFRWFHEGIDAFSHPIQGGSLYLEKFLPRLRHWVEEETFDAKTLESLIAETISFRKALQKKFETGRDRLLEWHSCRPEKVAPLIEEIRRVDASPELGDFLISAMDHFGIHVEKLGDLEGMRAWVLSPGHLMTDQLTLIPPEGKTITLDRKIALDRDDVEFMTWDHPLAISVMDLLLGSEAGNAAFTEVKASASLPVGLYMEMIHLLEATCPARHDLGRFLPVTPLRILLDTRGKTCSAKALQALDASSPVDAPKHALSGQSEALKPILSQWKGLAEESAESRVKEIRKQALANMTRTLSREIERCRSLQKRNGTTGGMEIEWLEEEEKALAKSIQESRLRLDALRLIRVS
jgi:ATP-dependent helicase HepA